MIRHHLFKCKKHLTWRDEREKEAQDQAQICEYTEEKARQEDNHLALVGTRASSLTDTDKEFCKDTVDQFLSSGMCVM